MRRYARSRRSPLPTVLGYLLPAFSTGEPLYTVAGWDVRPGWVAAGVAGALVIGAVNYRGVRFAAFAQRLAVGSLLLVGLAFFVPGAARGDLAHLVPAVTGWEGVLRVLVMTPFLYVGFDVIPQLAEEIALPLRTVGRIIVLSIAMALGWYALVQWTVGLTLPPDTLAGRALPTADAMSAVYGSPWGGRALVVGGAVGILTSWNAFFLGASRLLFAMARGGMLPAAFARLHPRYGSPAAVVVLLTVITASRRSSAAPRWSGWSTPGRWPRSWPISWWRSPFSSSGAGIRGWPAPTGSRPRESSAGSRWPPPCSSSCCTCRAARRPWRGRRSG